MPAPSASPCCYLLGLPNEYILLIGHAIAANRRIADLAATAQTCRALYVLLIRQVYVEAIESDVKQRALHLPPPYLSRTAVLPPVPVALWAAEHNRLDTIKRLWQAQQNHPQQYEPLACAYWYPMPRDCQDDLGHIQWRLRPWHQDQDPSFNAIITAGWCTALHIAAREGHDDVVRMLAKYGAHIDATARHVCVCRSLHMRLMIKDNGFVDPNEAPVATPLHVALANGNDHTARLLVQLGADCLQEVALEPSLYLTLDDDDGPSVRLQWDDPFFARNAPFAGVVVVGSSHEEISPLLPRLSNSTTPRPLWKGATLLSQIGSSHGATGLRIAAANAMLPFLSWLVYTGQARVGRMGEFYEEEEQAFRRSALHYAAHASVVIGLPRRLPNATTTTSLDSATAVSGHKVTRVTTEPPSTIQAVMSSTAESLSASAVEAAVVTTTKACMEQLVASLHALGVKCPKNEARAELVDYARIWGNGILADILEGCQ